jgi:hypothetical protein
MPVRHLTATLLLCAGCAEGAAASNASRAELAVTAEIVGSVSAARNADGALTLSAASTADPAVSADQGVKVVERDGAWIATAEGKGTRYVTLTY